MDTTSYICLGIVAVVVILLIIKKLMSLGVRMLMGVLTIAFLLFVTPRINTFLINKIGEYGIIENVISEIVDGDIETKVKYDYKLETGQELEDEGLLEKLKAEAYKVDPNMCDELNILMNCGFPAGIENTILLNIPDPGTPSITASSFSNYVAKYFVLRMTTLISFLIAFTVATNTFTVDNRNKYLG